MPPLNERYFRSFFLLPFFSVVLVCGCLVRVFSQSFYFKNYSITDGLASDQVLCLFQDSRGNLWVGTNGGGVSRFNGNSFVNFNVSNGLAGNGVRAVTEDSLGNIWIGTDEGITKYTGKRMTNYTDKDGLVSNNVNCLMVDNRGNLWVGTSGGVTEIVFKTHSSDAFLLRNFTTSEGLISNDVRAVHQDSSGIIWFGTEKGITQYFEKAGNNWGNLVKYYTVSDGLITNQVNDIYSDRFGNIIVATFSGGLMKYRPGEREKGGLAFTCLVNSPYINSKTVWSFLEDKKGNFWIGIWDIGLVRVHRKDADAGNPPLEIITSYHGLVSNKIFSLIQDNEENIWIGTYGGGITRFSGKRFETFTKQHGLADNFVWSVHRTAQQDIWVGCDAGGVTRMRFNREKNRYDITTFSAADGLSNDRVFCISSGSDDQLWLGTDNGMDFIRLDQEGSLRHITSFSRESGLMHDRVRTVYLDRNQNLWIAYYGGGVEKTTITFDQKKLPRIQPVPVDNNVLRNFMVYDIYEDPSGEIWFATNGGGVLKLDPHNIDAMVPAFASYTTREGLSNNDVRMIVPDMFGNLWFATGNGVSVLKQNGFDPNRSGLHSSASDQMFENFTMKDGLSSNRIYSVIFDNDTNLWIGSNVGIDRFDFRHFIRTREKIFKYYGYVDGFIGIETNSGAVLNDENGNLWFGTIGGLTKYNPDEDKHFTGESPVYITDMSVYMEYIPMTDDLELPYDRNHVTFDYIAINLSAPEKIRYQYKLDGFDHQWSPATSETYVNYNYLPPGSYTFLVKARNSEGIWNKDPVSFTFSVIPPFWQRWWFYLACLLLVMGAIYSLIRLRMRNLNKIADMLRDQVDARTRELKIEKENVEQKNSIIEKKNKDIVSSIRYARRIQEAILPPMERIKELLPGSFIFYRPKDIVSGDFYWIAAIDGKSAGGEEGTKAGTREFSMPSCPPAFMRPVILATADCTGHGVPGAFMSLIGNNLLEKIILHDKILDLSEIIIRVHTGIIESLKKFDLEAGTLEGMELALCLFDPLSRVLEFASAGRPLVVVHNNRTEVIKGGRFPLGLPIPETRYYPVHTINLMPNDSFYIFTDGYYDQFGGVSGKKYMFDRFCRMLVELQDLPVQDRERFLSETIDEWKTGWDQVDDILVIGVTV